MGSGFFESGYQYGSELWAVGSLPVVQHSSRIRFFNVLTNLKNVTFFEVAFKKNVIQKFQVSEYIHYIKIVDSCI